MSMPIPASLDASALGRRLAELVGDERQIQVDFLLHLDEFDRRRPFLEAGYGSLWDYCLGALHLREGAAGRHICAMRVLRRFPKLEAALREGRLCLSTVALLGQVLNDGNVDELVARAAYRTKAEVDHLVASIQPRRAPKEGVRKLPEPSAALIDARPSSASMLADGPPAGVASLRPPCEPSLATAEPAATAAPLAPTTAPLAPIEVPRPKAAEVRAVSQDQWSLRATIDGACKDDLEKLTLLLSHKLPGGDLAAVLHEAIRCALEKHGKRKGVAEPARKCTREAKPSGDPKSIPVAVQREVWKRDGGSCSWQGEDGRRCGSRWQLELDHIRPPLLGGTSIPSNLRLTCKAHNMLHAEEIYGREFMDLFRRGGQAAISGDSG